ncbi:GAF domain-containing protein [Dactylosporangium cerinum]|uniref:GAF domain-containing protein n=1 Tax=Dactylosporangium cerinum TaxID=1434730 RepID=A0ABV9WGP8_9ACTN
MLLSEQVALRRVTMLVARGAAPMEVFAAVTAELRRHFGGISTALARYETDGTITLVAQCDEFGRPMMHDDNVPIDGDSVCNVVLRSGRAARVNYDTATGPVAETMHGLGFRSAVGVPVMVEGRLWGVAHALSSKPDPLPVDTEPRLHDFTELVGAAIANADSRQQLIASRARLVTTADEARRKIERDLHDGAQQRNRVAGPPTAVGRSVASGPDVRGAAAAVAHRSGPERHSREPQRARPWHSSGAAVARRHLSRPQETRPLQRPAGRAGSMP